MAGFKFEHGAWVTVRHHVGVEWTGRIYRRADTGVCPTDEDTGHEYWVSGAPAAFPTLEPRHIPLLAWEYELSPATPAEKAAVIAALEPFEFDGEHECPVCMRNLRHSTACPYHPD